jgi:hypothetical protein
MNQWYELKQIASRVQFAEEEDSIIWKFNSSGKYFVQSLYAVINDRGIRQIFTPVMWKNPVTSRLHIILWFLANNKILTRENLPKRRKVENMSCLFCNEKETSGYLFFLLLCCPDFLGKHCWDMW